MTRLVLCLCAALVLFHPKEDLLKATYKHSSTTEIKEKTFNSISIMEALDLVKDRYAANFEKVFPEDTKEEYYYKLPDADYYLVYEGQVGTEQDYLFHLYEFVIDDPEIGIGHAVTYGWYTVKKQSGIITDQTQY